MIAIALREGLRTILVSQVDAALHGERRELRPYLVPLRIARQSRALAPLLSDPESMVPVFQFESGVPGLPRRVILLRRNHRRTKHVAAALRIEMRIGGHELGRLENHFAIFAER